MMCNNCIHKPVCAKYTATGGHVNKCEHFKEERKGEWVGEADGYADGELVYDVWYCSECNYCIDGVPRDPDILPNFCPNCGADMRGAENG